MAEFGKPLELFSPSVFSPMWSFWSRAAEVAVPAARNSSVVNLELLRLAGQRTRAYWSLPGQMGRCQNPQDVIELQIQFWHDAMRDYQTGSERIGEAWSSAFEPLRQAVAREERDVLSVRNADADDIESKPRTARRAA